MNSVDIAQHRLTNQKLAGNAFASPKEVVSWMGAIQAQDYAMAKWAVGVRLPGSTDDDVEQAINRGEIIRTHVMRPTWHLVSSNDVKWMLALTAPHLRKAMRSVHKSLGLTDQIFKRSHSIIKKSLTNNGYMTRTELVAELIRNKIKPDNLQTIHIMFNAELNGTICNGPMRGKQFTYALLEERIPKTKSLSREEALSELSKRYFTSHGPATIQDFAWWSGLPAAEAKISLETIKANLISEKIDNQVFWFADSSVANNPIRPIYFLPAYDEFIISYKDRTASLDSRFFSNAITNNGIFKPIIVVDGKVIGTWSRVIKKDRVIFKPQFFRSSMKLKKKEMMAAFQPFNKFLGMK
jgi:hypothetical protein